MKRLIKEEKGFTLIELIIVIAILAILAIIAIPNITGIVDNGRKTADISNATQIANAAMQVMAGNNEYGNTTLSEFDISDLKSSSTGFEGKLYEALNNKPPTPSFKKVLSGVTATSFYLTIESDGTITVSSGTDSKKVEVYPTAASVYNQ